jgi:hypothetical protein
LCLEDHVFQAFPFPAVMPAPTNSLRFPYERVLLQRTKLAYVHLGHMLTDAKRDRAARVFGYVAIWLPEELVILYLQEGEVVNATRTMTTARSEAAAIGEALAAVPHEAELGEICFHECADEQLACMFQTLTTPPEAWPAELDPTDRAALFPYLMSTTFDGTVEVRSGGLVNYLVVRDGEVERAFLWGRTTADPAEAIEKLFADSRGAPMTVRRWAIPPALPVQASPGLIRGYRELANSLVKRLIAAGQESAPVIAEQARVKLVSTHTALEHFTIGERPMRDPSEDVELVTTAIAVWMSELIWAAMDQAEQTPEQLLGEVTRERRHMFQSAGFFDRLPWAVEW